MSRPAATRTLALHGPAFALPTLRALGRRLAAMGALARQREDLAGMEDHRLQDLGLTRVEADREAARPMWDAPRHWR